MSAVAETIPTEMPAPFVFTDSAASKVAELIAEEGNPDLKLRVFVQGGGCSGFQYGFTFDEITNEDDTTMTKNGVSKARSLSSRTPTPPAPAAAVPASLRNFSNSPQKAAFPGGFLLSG
jgi:Iron-sulphur cluster biosynthesis